MQPSLTPILLVVEVGFWFAVAARAETRSGASLVAIRALLAWITLYAAITSVLGWQGVFVSDPVLASAPGLWLQTATVMACAGPALASRRVRADLRRVVDATPWAWWAWLHGLRVTALGTVQKALAGDFPGYFAFGVGLPDFAFGLSAFSVARRARRGAIDRRTFVAWNLIGAAIIVPAAPVLLQLGLPGPLYWFRDLPDARAVFVFPMSIAPIVGVPLLVLTNLCVAWRLWEQRRDDETGSPRNEAAAAR